MRFRCVLNFDVPSSRHSRVNHLRLPVQLPALSCACVLRGAGVMLIYDSSPRRPAVASGTCASCSVVACLMHSAPSPALRSTHIALGLDFTMLSDMLHGSMVHMQGMHSGMDC